MEESACGPSLDSKLERLKEEYQILSQKNMAFGPSVEEPSEFRADG